VVRGAPGTIVSALDLQRTVASVDDVLALSDIRTMESVVAREGTPRRVLAVLLGTFSLFALGLAVLGLYSSISYVVTQRQRELAVRIAIGATPASILRLILGEGAGTVGGGVAAGVMLSIAMAGVLTSQVYGVGATDATTFAAIVVMVVLTALFALAAPARRALRVDPATAMRAE
jgi:ABC-type antimicrobial peptide transport system permease subunit